MYLQFIISLRISCVCTFSPSINDGDDGGLVQLVILIILQETQLGGGGGGGGGGVQGHMTSWTRPPSMMGMMEVWSSWSSSSYFRRLNWRRGGGGVQGHMTSWTRPLGLDQLHVRSVLYMCLPCTYMYMYRYVPIISNRLSSIGGCTCSSV